MKNEEKYIKKTLNSLLNQLHRPFKIIIVDDGSTDNTLSILREYRNKHEEFIIIRRRDRGFSALGTPLMANTYNSGLRRIFSLDIDYLLIIGADTVLPPNYIESLLEKFREDPTLGIISGMHPKEPLSRFHVSGSGRMIRVEILKKMRLLPFIYGWESYEEVLAMSLGYHIKHYPEISFTLQRLGGTGHFRSYRGWGKAMYELGYPPLYVLARCVSNAMKGEVKRAIHMLIGYLSRPPVPEKVRPVRKYWNQHLKWYLSRLPLIRLGLLKEQ